MASQREGSKSSSKKRRLEVSIEHLSASEGLVAPYAAQFPAGVPDGLHERDSDDGIQFKAYKNTAPFKGKQQLLVARGQGVDYVGSNLPIKQGNQYAIGFFNKNDGTLKLTPLAGDKVFRMEPRVPGLEYDNTEATATQEEEQPELDQAALAAERKAKREMLVETFGSKKARIQQNARQREKVEEDAIAAPEALASMLATAVKTVPSREEATRSVTAIESRLIPPCNPDAATPSGVYPINRLIPPEVQAALSLDPYRKALKHPDRPMKMYFGQDVSSLVSRGLRRVSLGGSAQGDRLKCLAYLGHMVDFYRLNFKKIQEAFSGKRELSSGSGAEALAREVGMPTLVLEMLVDLFFERVEGPEGRTSYTRPQRAIDLMIAYILVLGLHVDDFCSDPADIAAALELTVPQLVPRYKELGCKVRKLSKAQKEESKDGSGYEVTLPIPVVFPKIKRGMKGS